MEVSVQGSADDEAKVFAGQRRYLFEFRSLGPADFAVKDRRTAWQGPATARMNALGIGHAALWTNLASNVNTFVPHVRRNRSGTANVYTLFWRRSIMLLMAAPKYKGKLGSFVKAMRESVGLTAEELADAIGCSRGAITSIEIGKTRLPGPEIVEGLARVFNVSQARIIYEAGYLTEYEAASLSRPQDIQQALETAERLRQTLAQLAATVDQSKPQVG